MKKILISCFLVLCMLVPSATAFAQTITESETTYISEHAETEIQTNIIEANSEEAAIIVEEPEDTATVVEKPEETTSAHETNKLPADVQERLGIASDKGLSEWVDTEGYLKPDFYQGKLSQYDLENMGVQPLINSFSEMERTARVRMLQNGIMTRAVTGFRDMVTDGVNVVGYFEVDGRVAVCIQHSVVTPGLGSPTGTPVESFNQELRKVLYYGSYGPGAILGRSDKDWVVTSLAASRANGDTAGTNAAVNFMNVIAGLPEAPSSFHVWVVDTNGGRTQDLAYWTLDEKGWATLNKTSANPDLTNNNSCYSLAGAEYGIYTEWDCINQAGTLTTDEWGNTNTVELNAGTYYVKGATRFPISIQNLQF